MIPFHFMIFTHATSFAPQEAPKLLFTFSSAPAILQGNLDNQRNHKIPKLFNVAEMRHGMA